MSGRRALALILVVVLGLATAGPAIGQSTEAEYVDRLDEICKNGSRAVKKQLNKLRPSSDPGFDAYRSGVTYQRVFAKIVRRIARVDKPVAIEEQARTFVRGLKRERGLTKRALRALRAGNAARLGKLGKRIVRVRKKNARNARKLGLRNCGRTRPQA